MSSHIPSCCITLRLLLGLLLLMPFCEASHPEALRGNSQNSAAGGASTKELLRTALQSLSRLGTAVTVTVPPLAVSESASVRLGGSVEQPADSELRVSARADGDASGSASGTQTGGQVFGQSRSQQPSLPSGETQGDGTGPAMVASSGPKLQVVADTDPNGEALNDSDTGPDGRLVNPYADSLAQSLAGAGSQPLAATGTPVKSSQSSTGPGKRHHKPFSYGSNGLVLRQGGCVMSGCQKGKFLKHFLFRLP